MHFLPPVVVVVHYFFIRDIHQYPVPGTSTSTATWNLLSFVVPPNEMTLMTIF